MIYLGFSGLDFQNQLTDMVKLFFNEDEICSSYECPLPEGAGVFLYGSGVEKDTGAGYIISLRDGRAGISLEYYADFPGGIPKAGDIEGRRSFKREIRRGVYSILSEYTGRKLPWGILTGIRPVKIVHELHDSGFDNSRIEEKLKEYFMLSAGKASLITGVADIEREILKSTDKDLVSVYIGIPFCTTRCLYCSFTSNQAKPGSDIVDRYLAALYTEMGLVKGLISEKGYRVQSIYIGGGTPTSLDRRQLEQLLECIGSSFDFSGLCEYTLEAGRPDSLDEGKLRTIRDSAVNRISINPQTMNNETLRLIGRNHTAEDVDKAFGAARKMGFGNINMDIIIGLPGEDLEIFKDTLRKIEKLGPESLTVHSLALKRASRLAMERYAAGAKMEKKPAFRWLPEQEASDMSALAYEYAKSMGMRPYYLYRQKNITGNLENTGYCKPGFESRYNIHIMEERQTIIAIGAGAVTKVVWPEENRIERAFNVKNVEEYICRIEEMVLRKGAILNGNGVSKEKA